MLVWKELSKSMISEPKFKERIDIIKSITPRTISQDVAITDMTTLSESMTKHQELLARIQKGKGDTRMKVRNKLNRIQKNYISLEGVEVDGIVPSKVIEEMLSIVGCQDGARLDQYPK